MKPIQIPTRFFIQNRRSLIKNLKPGSLALVTSNDELTRSGDQHFPFRQNADFFYLTGIEQEKSILALCPDHPDIKLREVLFALKPNEQLETWKGHKYSDREIREISGIETVKWLEDFELILREMVLVSQHVYLNLNECSKYLPDVSYRDYNMVTWMKERYPLHTYHRLAPLLTRQRMIKSAEEIELIRSAAGITGSAFNRVLKLVKPGIMEYEIEAAITHEFISRGLKGHAYQPIIASGKNALVLHYVENSGQCRDGDLLLMDFGAEYANYAADCTRTIPVNGKFTPRQRQCYEAVLKVQKEAVGLFVPGNSIDLVNKKVREMMEREMTGLGLFAAEDINNQDSGRPVYFKYLMHGVTHFLGLDVHDVGSKYETFKKGMVLTLEPGLYIREENMGIRIEDNILIADEPINLTAHIPKEIGDLERLMANPVS